MSTWRDAGVKKTTTLPADWWAVTTRTGGREKKKFGNLIRLSSRLRLWISSSSSSSSEGSETLSDAVLLGLRQRLLHGWEDGATNHSHRVREWVRGAGRWTAAHLHVNSRQSGVQATQNRASGAARCRGNWILTRESDGERFNDWMVLEEMFASTRFKDPVFELLYSHSWIQISRHYI